MFDDAVDTHKSGAIQRENSMQYFPALPSRVLAVARNALNPGIRENRQIEVDSFFGIPIKHHERCVLLNGSWFIKFWSVSASVRSECVAHRHELLRPLAETFPRGLEALRLTRGCSKIF